jgi:succinate dehydrogenase/fumarate reductase flavoprotein subunit
LFPSFLIRHPFFFFRERGAKVVILDKNAFLGGNSTKATSGINGAPTLQQQKLNIHDSAQTFLDDTVKGGSGGDPNMKPWPLAKVLTYESGPAVDWLANKFGLDLSLVSRLGGHSNPRTHRGKERFPGMTITYGLMEKYEEICTVCPASSSLSL